MLFNKCRKMTKDSEDKEKKDKQKSKKYPMNKKRMMIFAIIILILVVSLQIGNNSSSDYSSCFDVSEYSLQENRFNLYGRRFIGRVLSEILFQ